MTIYNDLNLYRAPITNWHTPANPEPQRTLRKLARAEKVIVALHNFYKTTGAWERLAGDMAWKHYNRAYDDLQEARKVADGLAETAQKAVLELDTEREKSAAIEKTMNTVLAENEALKAQIANLTAKPDGGTPAPAQPAAGEARLVMDILRDGWPHVAPADKEEIAPCLINMMLNSPAALGASREWRVVLDARPQGKAQSGAITA